MWMYVCFCVNNLTLFILAFFSLGLFFYRKPQMLVMFDFQFVLNTFISQEWHFWPEHVGWISFILSIMNVYESVCVCVRWFQIDSYTNHTLFEAVEHRHRSKFIIYNIEIDNFVGTHIEGYKWTWNDYVCFCVQKFTCLYCEWYRDMELLN